MNFRGFGVLGRIVSPKTPNPPKDLLGLGPRRQINQQFEIAHFRYGTQGHHHPKMGRFEPGPVVRVIKSMPREEVQSSEPSHVGVILVETVA